MELNSPTEARFRVSGEDKTRVSLNTHGSVMGIHSRGLLGREHSLHLSLSLSLSLIRGSEEEYQRDSRTNAMQNRGKNKVRFEEERGGCERLWLPPQV